MMLKSERKDTLPKLVEGTIVAVYTVGDLRNFITSLKDLDTAACLFRVRQTNLRYLKKCVWIDKFRELSNGKQKMIRDWIG